MTLKDTLTSLKSMVSDGKQVEFRHYKDGALWYATESGFLFPVPIEDIGSATFLARDKALLMMRYIRKHIDLVASAKDETTVPADVTPEEPC